MESAKEILEKHTIVIVNQALKHGFAQLPRYVLMDKRLSFGARLTYAVLLSYAWQEERCFPGQARMARDLGTTDRSVRTFLRELRDNGYIDWKRQGLTKSNLYCILDYQPLQLQADRKPTSGPERKHIAAPERKPASYKYKQISRLRTIKSDRGKVLKSNLETAQQSGTGTGVGQRRAGARGREVAWAGHE